MGDDQVLATFFGDDEFPIEWEDGQRELFWVHDDLHIPNPVSPMYADIGGWWLKCDYMFRRFGTPFASDWIVKIINGYVYTAAIPAQPGLSAEASEYGSRYTPRVPLDPKDPDELGHYMGWTLPYYAEHFLDWWRGRLRPEMERNFVRFDEFDYDQASLVELAILLEDAIDMHDRHWQIHWVLNFAQFSATLALNAAITAAKGEGDHGALMGRLQSSTENRNWDSIEELWRIKEWVKAEQGEVAKAFQRPTAADILHALEATDGGRAFVADKIVPYQKGFGFKSMWAHEFSFRTWRENPAPIVEAIRGYLETDYDYPAELKAVADDLEAAKAEALRGVEPGPAHDELQRALALSLRMTPLTPDHHFYIDQGTNARVRLVLVAIGRALVNEGKARRPRGRHVPPLQRAAPAYGRQQLLRRQGAGLRPARRPRAGLRAAAAGLGRHGDQGRGRLPLPARCGRSRRSWSGKPPETAERGPRPGGVVGRGGRHGPRGAVARGVRFGPA